ncbi:MAG: PIN domain-containing protein [Bdellovibrio sp.]|nr:PIN domain-containing protein [Bdellovibrio sp.]
MNVIIVDTSAWISYFKNTLNDDLDLALKESRVYLPPLVAAELLSSNLNSLKRTSLMDFLLELQLCTCNLEHWMRVGELRAELSKQGLHISTPDAHIAQCTIDVSGYLLTEDKIFNKIANIKTIKLL